MIVIYYYAYSILATDPIMKEGVEDYLISMNVTIKKIDFVQCDKPIVQLDQVKTKKDKEANTCIKPYSDVKIRWGRYPFLRDALIECKKCTGPVLVSDARDVFFQRDPFSDGAKNVNGIEFFSEHRVNADHWFVARRVRICKDGFEMNGPMLCSGTIIGDRKSMISFFNIMYNEMKLWMITDQCYFNSHGGDQAIMNYLYYANNFTTNDIVTTTIYPPRVGTVNTVGVLGLKISKQHHKDKTKMGVTSHKITPFSGADDKTWLGLHLDQTDEFGYFIDFDGTRSRVIHQFDRFGPNLEDWINKGQIY